MVISFFARCLLCIIIILFGIGSAIADDYYLEFSIKNPEFYANNFVDVNKSKGVKYPLALDFNLTSFAKKMSSSGIPAMIEDFCYGDNSPWIAERDCNADNYHFQGKFYLHNPPPGTYLLRLKADYLEEELKSVSGHRIKPSKIIANKLESIGYMVSLVNLTNGKATFFNHDDYPKIELLTHGKFVTIGSFHVN